MVLHGNDYTISVNDLVKMIFNENAEEDKYCEKEDKLIKEHKDNTLLFDEIEAKRNAIVSNSKSGKIMTDMFNNVSKDKVNKLADLSDDANKHSRNLVQDFKLVNKLIPNCVKVESASCGETPHNILNSKPNHILNFLNLLAGDITDTNTTLVY